MILDVAPVATSLEALLSVGDSLSLPPPCEVFSALQPAALLLKKFMVNKVSRVASVLISSLCPQSQASSKPNTCSHGNFADADAAPVDT